MASLRIYQKTNDETNKEIEALLAQAEAIKNSPDEYLGEVVESEAMAYA